MFTIGRVLTLVYVLVVVVLAYQMPAPSAAPEFKAMRYLSPNTRIVSEVLSRPAANWFGYSTHLDRELQAMQGKYLTSGVRAGTAVTQSAVSTWPSVGLQDSTVVELGAEPDYATLNAGTVAQVTWGEKSVPARVLSIVPSGSKKWLAFLRKSDLAGVSSADLHGVTLRVLSLPEEPPPNPQK